MSGESLAWILEAPQETAARRVERPSADLSDLLVACSALLSAALSEVYLSKGDGRQLAAGFVSYSMAFVSIVWLFRQISTAFSERTASFGAWFSAGALSVVPFHLLLPAALMARPFGAAGLFAFELFKLALLAPVYRRALWSIRALTGWPTWAATLLIVVPFALSMAVFMIAFFFGLVLGGIAVLGKLAM